MEEVHASTDLSRQPPAILGGERHQHRRLRNDSDSRLFVAASALRVVIPTKPVEAVP